MIKYRVASTSKSKDKAHEWGLYPTREEAQEKLERQSQGSQLEWAEQCHKDWRIEEVDVTGMFVIPEETEIREEYKLEIEKVDHGKGYWHTQKCKAIEVSTGRVAGEWEYKYSGRPPFEVFRQNEKRFALMSTHYTATSVIDLQTGVIIASEEANGHGFCPVGFYVPDWYDVHDNSIVPGSKYWHKRNEEPSGKYGFVWGCVWGDDTSWKLQYLDLSKIQEGIISRDERFGYVELANISAKPQDFINVYTDMNTIEVATWQRFDLDKKVE